MIEICPNVIVSHLSGQRQGGLPVTDALREVRNEVLEHEADVARGGNATVWGGYISQLHLERFEERRWVLLDEDLLDQDQRLLEERIMLADIDLLPEQLQQLLPLLSGDRRAEIVQHEVIVEHHIEHQVALVFMSNFVINSLEHSLSFGE